ncbi:hypothetical protein R50073_21180 [Maricurvus nonylphenolicus]|uniref:class I SAM-dependent methyltransferase n=1 Tax=Maricurvus nonylphenolicus TaxID=1008307 RepID=UPI0036F1E059
MKTFNDLQILNSWQKNVAPWVQAIRDQEITSRTTVTNQAIVDAVVRLPTQTLLDVGCGEGWLMTALSEYNITCLGIDAVADFAEFVEQQGHRFQLLAYEDFCAEAFPKAFDVIACNFSLLGKESVERVIQHSIDCLNPGGRLLIQTLHPQATCDGNYQDGWRPGSWDGFNQQFSDPAPWYFRTRESWLDLLSQTGYTNINVTEPCYPETGLPASILFEASVEGQ